MESELEIYVLHGLFTINIHWDVPCTMKPPEDRCQAQERLSQAAQVEKDGLLVKQLWMMGTTTKKQLCK